MARLARATLFAVTCLATIACKRGSDGAAAIDAGSGAGRTCTSDDECPLTDPAGAATCYKMRIVPNTPPPTCVEVRPGVAGSAPCLMNRVNGRYDDAQGVSHETPPARAYFCDTSHGLSWDSDSHACSPARQVGQHCVDDADCQPGDHCAFDVPTKRVCEHRFPEGATCDTDLQACATSLFCDTGSKPWRCRKRLGDGESKSAPSK